MSTTYVLVIPATPADIGSLLVKILEETESLEDRVKLQYGTCRLLCRDENEREEHPHTVTVRESLLTLSASLLPEALGSPRVSLLSPVSLTKKKIWVFEYSPTGGLTKNLVVIIIFL